MCIYNNTSYNTTHKHKQYLDKVGMASAPKVMKDPKTGRPIVPGGPTHMRVLNEIRRNSTASLRGPPVGPGLGPRGRRHSSGGASDFENAWATDRIRDSIVAGIGRSDTSALSASSRSIDRTNARALQISKDKAAAARALQISKDKAAAALHSLHYRPPKFPQSPFDRLFARQPIALRDNIVSKLQDVDVLALSESGRNILDDRPNPFSTRRHVAEARSSRNIRETRMKKWKENGVAGRLQRGYINSTFVSRQADADAPGTSSSNLQVMVRNIIRKLDDDELRILPEIILDALNDDHRDMLRARRLTPVDRHGPIVRGGVLDMLIQSNPRRGFILFVSTYGIAEQDLMASYHELKKFKKGAHHSKFRDGTQKSYRYPSAAAGDSYSQRRKDMRIQSRLRMKRAGRSRVKTLREEQEERRRREDET